MRPLAYALLLALGCAPAAQTSQAIRQTTYPQSFKYLEQKKVRNEMISMASAIHKLDEQLRPVEGKAVDQKEVERLLQEIDRLAGELDPAGLRTNHQELDANIASFRKDIQGALKDAQRSPPNYFLAGAISGSCSYCHR